MARRALPGETSFVAESLIERDEVVALLFNVSHLVAGVTEIIDLLKEEGDGEEEADEG